MIPERNVVTVAEVMFVTIQRENILPSKITDYWLTNARELLTTEWLKYYILTTDKFSQHP
jgi:hypothetical protein